jgi:hypothetical protein
MTCSLTLLDVIAFPVGWNPPSVVAVIAFDLAVLLEETADETTKRKSGTTEVK